MATVTLSGQYDIELAARAVQTAIAAMPELVLFCLGGAL